MAILGLSAIIAIIGLVAEFLRWLWNMLLSLLSWIYLAPGRLLNWVLSWPFYIGHILVSAMASLVLLLIFLHLFTWIVEFAWRIMLPRSSRIANSQLKGRVVRWNDTVCLLHAITNLDPDKRTARVVLRYCEPVVAGNERLGILQKAESVKLEIGSPREYLVSAPLCFLRRPAASYSEAMLTQGIHLLDPLCLEAKAWQAIIDAADELARLEKIREHMLSMSSEVKGVLGLSENNELLEPSRGRARRLEPLIKKNITKIGLRESVLRTYEFKLCEFLKIPPALRSTESENDIDAALLSLQGSADELFKEISLTEKALDELMRG